MKTRYILSGLALLLACTACSRRRHDNNNPEHPDSGRRDTVILPGRDSVRELRVPDTLPTLNFNTFLYQFCGNSVTIEQTQGFSSPQLTATNATVIHTPDRAKFVISPQTGSCDVTFSARRSDSSLFRKPLTFLVIPPPKPEIEVLVNGQKHNGVAPINKRSSLLVRLQPDREFLALYPKDARYIISEVQLLVQRSLGAPAQVLRISGNGKDAVRGISMELGNTLNSDPPGTKIYLRIVEISRINFQNQKITERFSDADLHKGLVLK